MPALESRYDHESSTASSGDEDFVHASSGRSAGGAAVARTASRASSAGSRPPRDAHSSSSSESSDTDTDSEEEQALRDELADVDGGPAGMVRGAPAEGRVERVMRSIGKGSNGGARSGQRYAAVDAGDDDRAAAAAAERRHRKKKRSGSRSRSRRGGVYALGKDDPAPGELGGSGAPGQFADDRDDLEAGAPAGRGRRKTAAGGGGEGPSPSTHKRKWYYLAAGSILVILVAIGVGIYCAKATHNSTDSALSNHSTTSNHSTASGGQSMTAVRHQAANADMDWLSTSPESSSSASTSKNALNAAAFNAAGAATTDKASTSASVTGEDGEHAISTAAATTSSQALELGQWGSVDASPASQTDAHDSVSSVAGPLPTTTGDFFAQTTMPPGVSVPSTAVQDLSATKSDAHAAPAVAEHAADPNAATVASPASSATSSADGEQSFATSVPLGPGPVVVGPTPLSAGGADATMTSAPAQQWGAPQASAAPVDGQSGGQEQPQSPPADDGKWHPSAADQHAQDGGWQAPAAAPAPSQGQDRIEDGSGAPAAAPAPSAADGEWQASSPATAPAPSQWNPDGTPVIAAPAGPFAVAEAYQATAPEAIQSYQGNATWFEASQHFGACGIASNKTDYVVGLSNAMWLNSTHGSETAPSSYCGQEVLLTNAANGLSIKAWVTERCAFCVGDASIDLSIPVFSALSSDNLDVGVISVLWGFTGNSTAVALPAVGAPASSSAAPTSSSASSSSSSNVVGH
ncbi:hypothetical protein JCM3770_004019 [Rhodotorula araucariae]